MAGSLAMATGPVLGGWIYDMTRGFGVMYLACFGLGLAGFLAAIRLRPFARVGVAQAVQRRFAGGVARGFHTPGVVWFAEPNHPAPVEYLKRSNRGAKF